MRARQTVKWPYQLYSKRSSTLQNFLNKRLYSQIQPNPKIVARQK